MVLPSEASIRASVLAALAEDLGPGWQQDEAARGDLSAALVDRSAVAEAVLLSRERGVLAGRPWFDAVCAAVDARIGLNWAREDGECFAAGDVLCRLQGPARALLTAERSAMNFLQTLSATATVTAAFVEAVRGLSVRILDTRKTLPGLRVAQKYAVRCGGGANHRMGLFDAVLIKENHIEAAGGIKAAVAAARQAGAGAWVEVEVESLEQLSQALEAGVERVMLDNFSSEQMVAAVALNREAACPARLEASGNVDLDSVRGLALTGVDDISVGALTKHVQALDLSMRFVSS